MSSNSYLKFTAFAALAFVTCAEAGCSKGNQLDVAPVHGKVTFDGKPLRGGAVVFQPLRGKGSTGFINNDGTYSMQTYGNHDGAIVGPNKVAVLPKTSGTFVMDDPSSSSNNPYSSFPNPYTIPGTSGIETTVEAGKDNQFDINLHSKKPAN